MRLWLSPVVLDSNVCSQCLSSPSKAAQANESRGRGHVHPSKITLVYILSLFKRHAPRPRAATTRSAALLQPPTYIRPSEVFIHLLFAAFLHDIPLRIPSVPCRGSGSGRGMKLRAISPYRWWWHHWLYFLHAGQQHLRHPNKMNALRHLRSDNEAKSVSSPGRGDYCQIRATP